MKPDPTPKLDRRFSDPEAEPTPLVDAVQILEQAELYWLTTVRADGRPHVTPLIAVVADGEVHFCTGLGEQKARNLEHSPHVVLTTGNNTWDKGLDVVVEGTTVRITDQDTLQRVADAYETKYGSVWHFDVVEGGFGTQSDVGGVFRIEAAKVLAFAKEPHGQTSYRFSGSRAPGSR